MIWSRSPLYQLLMLFPFVEKVFGSILAWDVANLWNGKGKGYCVTRHFQTIFQLYRDDQFYWWRKPEYPEKTTDLSCTRQWQTLLHNVVSSTPSMSFENSVNHHNSNLFFKIQYGCRVCKRKSQHIPRCIILLRSYMQSG